MKTLTLTLTQHTPLLHFNDGRNDSTLRATEVKPKLDHWLANHLKQDDLAQYHIPGAPSKEALNYKMHIVASSSQQPQPSGGGGKTPMFFGKDKKCVYNGDDSTLTVIIRSHFDKLIQRIEKQICEFFLTTNFGTRQSKGYGGFEVTQMETDGETKSPTITAQTFFENESAKDKIRFEIKVDKWDEAFKQLELFYKSIRGGINGNENYGLYCKPVIFYFAKEHEWQWEKKSIKVKFLKETVMFTRYKKEYKGLGIEDQQKEYKDTDSPVHYSSKKAFLIRDLLGLSIYASWGSYGVNVIKQYTVTEKSKPVITRIPSPFYFKVFRAGQKLYQVMFLMDDKLISQTIISRIQREFKISIRREENKPEKPSTISWPNDSCRKSDEKLKLKFPWIQDDTQKSVYSNLYAYIKKFDWDTFQMTNPDHCDAKTLKAMYESKKEFNGK